MFTSQKYKFNNLYATISIKKMIIKNLPKKKNLILGSASREKSVTKRDGFVVPVGMVIIEFSILKLRV